MLKIAGMRPYKVLKHIASAGKADLVPTCSVLDQHVPDRPLCRRGFASQNASSEPSVLRKVLRELYKRVHPDLFHDVPHAREANEHSFKLLQVPCLAPVCRVTFSQSAQRFTCHGCCRPLQAAMNNRQVLSTSAALCTLELLCRNIWNQQERAESLAALQACLTSSASSSTDTTAWMQGLRS